MNRYAFIGVLFSATLLPYASSSELSHEQAQSVINTIEINSEDIYSTWGLTLDEYNQYLHLMENSQAKFWYQQLDPAEVLGIMAETSDERAHYAEIVARQAYERVDRELEFMRAYRVAYQKIFPYAQPFNMPSSNLAYSGITNYSPSNGDRYLLFIETNSRNTVLSKLIQQIEDDSAIGLDIYLVNENTESEARAWAASQKIDPQLVGQSRITINLEQGELSQVSSEDVSLPFVVLRQGAEFTPIALNSL